MARKLDYDQIYKVKEVVGYIFSVLMKILMMILQSHSQKYKKLNENETEKVMSKK